MLLPHDSDRAAIMDSLKAIGIQTSIHYPGFWTFSAYAQFVERSQAPISAQICDKELTLPLYPTMSSTAVDEVCVSLLKTLNA